MSLGPESESNSKVEVHEKRSASERVWHFKKFPELTIDDIEFELTPASKALFERGKPGQGYLALGEITASGKIILHLIPAFDISKSDDPEVKGIGDRPELMGSPIKPEDPTKEQQLDKDFMEKYHAQMKEWQVKEVKYQAYLKKDKAWMEKWEAWVKNPKNFVDRNGVPYAPNEFVPTGDANVKGNTGIGHKRMVKILGLTAISGVNSELIGFGIWKGKRTVLRKFAERSLSQNANSVLWHDQFFKQYVDNGMEMYGISGSILEGAIKKMKLPAFVISVVPPGKYIVDQNKKIHDCGSEIDRRIISRLRKTLIKEKSLLISYEKFSNLKTMVELSDKSLNKLGLPRFVKLTKQQEAIKNEMLSNRVRSLPWALSEKMLGHLLENLPNTPYAEGEESLSREVEKEDDRSVLMTNPIFDAVKNGNLEEVQKWIDAGGSPNEIGCPKEAYAYAYTDRGFFIKHSLSLIEVALKNKQIQVFQYLFRHPKFEKEKHYSKLLLKSIESDFSEITSFLLEAEFTPRKQDSYLQESLKLALEKECDKEIILGLLKKGAFSSSYRDSQGRDLLMIALEKEADPEIMKELLKNRDIDLATTDRRGRSAFIIALEKGADITLELLKRGAAINPSYTDNLGRNALLIALAMGAGIDIIKALLERNILDVKKVTKLGKNALMIAFYSEADKEVIKLLLATEIDLTQVDSQGKNALAYAREYNADPEIIQEIEKRMEGIEQSKEEGRRRRP